MSDPEWISLFFNAAGSRLARYWGISPHDAEDIIRRVLHRRKILVRSDGPDIYFPRMVTRELPATLLKEVFFSPEFSEAQVIWDELLAACHEEVTASENTELHKLKDSERADTLAALEARSDEGRSAARETPTRKAAITRTRPGPAPGTVRRYNAADMALFPEMERLMSAGKSRTAAARTLEEAGKITGPGSPTSKVKRLAKLYKLYETQSKSGESGN